MEAVPMVEIFGVKINPRNARKINRNGKQHCMFSRSLHACTVVAVQDYLLLCDNFTVNLIFSVAHPVIFLHPAHSFRSFTP